MVGDHNPTLGQCATDNIIFLEGEVVRYEVTERVFTSSPPNMSLAPMYYPEAANEKEPSASAFRTAYLVRFRPSELQPADGSFTDRQVGWSTVTLEPAPHQAS